jgi:hypothetical protein
VQILAFRPPQLLRSLQKCRKASSSFLIICSDPRQDAYLPLPVGLLRA